MTGVQTCALPISYLSKISSSPPKYGLPNFAINPKYCKSIHAKEIIIAKNKTLYISESRFHINGKKSRQPKTPITNMLPFQKKTDSSNNRIKVKIKYKPNVCFSSFIFNIIYHPFKYLTMFSMASSMPTCFSAYLRILAVKSSTFSFSKSRLYFFIIASISIGLSSSG